MHAAYIIISSSQNNNICRHARISQCACGTHVMFLVKTKISTALYDIYLFIYTYTCLNISEFGGIVLASPQIYIGTAYTRISIGNNNNNKKKINTENDKTITLYNIVCSAYYIRNGSFRFYR